jgi:cobalamin biosynthesis protein CbiG
VKLARQIALLVGIFAVTTLVAELAGAANLGVSIGIAQVVFAIALVAVLMRG